MSDLHALLIGIDCYLPNQLPDGSRYESLSGSVRDVERVESFLNEELGDGPKRILKLTSSRGPEGPAEPRDRWPTYENMVDAFRELVQGAAPGDQVYVHYSGHGGRPATIFPEIRGDQGYDEALVPCDIGNSEARYLRGAEISRLIREMVDKNLMVTVVFDCCHSAGVRRGLKKVMRRGLEVVDRTPRPRASLVASREELLEALRRPAAPGETMRNAFLESWLGEPKGYVFLAACRPHESALEFPFEDGESQGVLTHALLDTLRHGGTSLTCNQVFDVVKAKVHTDFQSQTPMLVGEADRPFFRNGALGPRTPPARRNVSSGPRGVTVLSMDASRLLLDIGQAQGARVGARFAIYPSTAELAKLSRPQAVVEIEEIGATASWAKIVESTRSLIRQGAQAVLAGFDPGTDTKRLQGVVRIGEETGKGGALLKGLRSMIEGNPQGFLRLEGGGDPVDFQVAVNARGEGEIQDPEGRPLPNLRPPVKADRPGAMAELERRLIHLTLYRNVRRIENADDESPLKGRLGLKVLGTQLNFVPGDRPEPRPAGPPPLDLQVGEWLFIEVANHSSRVLNFTVLDLQPDWGISRIFPSKNDAPFWPLDPGEAKMVRIRCYLPNDYEEAADIIKVFATVGTPNLRSLLLPPLDRPTPDSTNRHASVSIYASEEWTTEQLEIRVRR